MSDFFYLSQSVCNTTLAVCAATLTPILMYWLLQHAWLAEYRLRDWREQDRRERERAQRGFD